MWPLLLVLTTLMPVSFCNTTAVWDLPAPTNVHIDSYNMKHILKWDPVQAPNKLIPVMYNVQCELYGGSRTMCVNITETQCDFTGKIEDFWRGKYKVRAELGERQSDWVEVAEFQANKHTRIGPVQSLVLEPHENTVNVNFSPPFWPIPNTFKMKYYLYYWKEGTESKTEVSLRVSTYYILKKLEELTVYCVQVKASTDHKEGEMSDRKCVMTKTRDYTGRELAVIVACVICVCTICSVIGLIIYRNKVLLKSFLYPPFRMPNHIQEFLENLPEQPCEAAFHQSHKEEHYDGISLIESTFFLEGNQMCADPNLVPAEKT